MHLLREYVRFILSEGKVERLQKKFPDVDVKELASYDFSSTKKYLEWMIKQAKLGYRYDEIKRVVTEFDKKINNLDVKDINQYKNIGYLQHVLDNTSSLSKRELIKYAKLGSQKIYEDDQAYIYKILNHEACILYGKNTKWCITSVHSSDWDEYEIEGFTFFFVIRKNSIINDQYSKIAIPVLYDVHNSAAWLSNNVQCYEGIEILYQIYVNADKMIKEIENNV